MTARSRSVRSRRARVRYMLYARYLKNLLFFYRGRGTLDGSTYCPGCRLSGDRDFLAHMLGELVGLALQLMGRPIVFGESVMAVAVCQAALNRSQAGRLAGCLPCILRLQPNRKEQEHHNKHQSLMHEHSPFDFHVG